MVIKMLKIVFRSQPIMTSVPTTLMREKRMLVLANRAMAMFCVQMKSTAKAIKIPKSAP